MPKVNLSHNFVCKAVCPEGKKKIVFWDTKIKGFILEVRSSGNRTYALRYRSENGSQKQLKLGSTEDISFEKARRAAEIARGKVVLGQDPCEEKRTKKKTPTLGYFVEFHYLVHIKHKRSFKTDLSMLRCHILPRFGKTHMDKINTQAISDFHHGMVSKGLAKGTANRGLVLIKYMFNLAIKWKTPGVNFNPAVGVKLFNANNARERYLTTEEAQRLLAAAENSKNPQLKNIITLLLLTGCRKRELLDAKWSEFDLDRRIWRISMSKSGKSRHVPLSKAALDVLNQLSRWEGCPYLVPNPETLKPYSQIHKSWTNVLKSAEIQDFRVHDLRHSCASFMIGANISLFEISKILGHSNTRTTERYSHLSNEKLIHALDAAAEATGTDWGK